MLQSCKRNVTKKKKHQERSQVSLIRGKTLVLPFFVIFNITLYRFYNCHRLYMVTVTQVYLKKNGQVHLRLLQQQFNPVLFLILKQVQYFWLYQDEFYYLVLSCRKYRIKNNFFLYNFFKSRLNVIVQQQISETNVFHSTLNLNYLVEN